MFSLSDLTTNPASGAAKSPPTTRPATADRCSVSSPALSQRPVTSARTNVTDMLSVMRNSLMLTVPTTYRAVPPNPSRPVVTIGPQPPPPAASRKPPAAPSGATMVGATGYFARSRHGRLKLFSCNMLYKCLNYTQLDRLGNARMVFVFESPRAFVFFGVSVEK